MQKCVSDRIEELHFLAHNQSIISGYTYPQNYFASSLQKKCNEMEFLQCVCIRIFPRKDCSDQRKDLSFRRPILGFRRLLWDECGNLSDCEKILCIRSFPCETSSTIRSNPFVSMMN